MFKHFSRDEFACSHTGNNEIQDKFIEMLDILRENCGFPFVITSGYRDPSHPDEISKEQPGTHSKVIASDNYVSDGSQRRSIIENAIAIGFGGIGVATGFVHVDIRDTTPVIWTY